MKVTPITVNYFFGANSYLVKTEAGHILIDSGISKKRDQLEEQLEEAGCLRGNLKLIIITHGHLDHVGNAAYLRDKYGAKIAMHRGDLRMIETGDMFVDAGGGIMIGVVKALMKALGLSRYERFAPDLYLEDGQDLSPYGLNATVIHTPGHSDGSISVLTSEGSLFCGDLLNNNGKPGKATLIQDQGQLDASFEKIGALGVVDVYPGHGGPFKMEQLKE